MNTTSTTPTVVLVHGAFADGSSWAGVIARLQAAGVAALAVANPLRGLTHDGGYVADVVKQVAGPVVLVGHSYGGPVITHAGSVADNVKALVYVASFGVDKGVSALASVAGFAETELNSALVPQQFGSGETEFTIRQDLFPRVFAADLPTEQTAVNAASQRPAAEKAFAEALTVEPAWKKLPSWFAVAAADRVINPDSQRAAAKRLNATMVDVKDVSHAIAVSRPEVVSDLILEAVRTVSS